MKNYKMKLLKLTRLKTTKGIYGGATKPPRKY